MGRVIPDTNLPPGLSTAHPHFWDCRPDGCPDCGSDVGDDVYCARCGAVLDPDEAAAIERDLDYDRQYDMGRER